MHSIAPLFFSTPTFTTTSLGTNDPQVGDRRRFDDEDYLFVYNNGATQILPGDGAVVTAVSGYSVTVSSVTSVDFLVGVGRGATIAASAYGWLVTRGFTQVNMGADVSAAAGGLLVLGTDGKFGQKSISTGYVANAVGKAMAAIASGASGTAYIAVW